MARIRYLKPDFFKDEDLSRLPQGVRLLYQGLWCHADKEGRLEDRPQRLKVEIFPYEEFDIEAGLKMLSKHKITKRPFIFRYAVDGENYIQILQWRKHQKPHHTEKESVLPRPPNGCLTVNEPLDNSEELLQVHGDGKGNGEGNGNGNGKESKASPASYSQEFINKAKTAHDRGFNIYQLTNKYLKGKAFTLPEAVLNKVLDRFLSTGDTVKEVWPYFLTVLADESKRHNAAKNEAEGDNHKKQPVSLGEILSCAETTRTA
jgi:hypothetical protein